MDKTTRDIYYFGEDTNTYPTVNSVSVGGVRPASGGKWGGRQDGQKFRLACLRRQKLTEI